MSTDSNNNFFDESLAVSKISMIKINEAKNMRRFYRVSIGRGLFGYYVLREWGRIDSRLRRMECFCSDLAQAVLIANNIVSRKVNKAYTVI